MAVDLLAGVGMLTASIVIVWAALSRPGQTGGGGPRPPVYRVGDEVELSGVVDGRSTLVIYLSPTCRFCSESMGFYRTLAALSNRVALVVVGADSVSALTAYVQQHEFRPDGIHSVPRQSLKFPGTPVVFLVSGDARISRIWPGKLSAVREREVLAAVAEPAIVGLAPSSGK